MKKRRLNPNPRRKVHPGPIERIRKLVEPCENCLKARAAVKRFVKSVLG